MYERSERDLTAEVIKLRNIDVLNRVVGLDYGFSSSLFGNMAVKYGGVEVASNRRNFAQAAGIDLDRVVVINPDHGALVLMVDGSDVGREMPKADALITTEAGVVLTLFPADCAPVIITNCGADFAAMVHAGRKGLEAGVIGETVKKLEGMGFKSREMVVGLGPMANCYEPSYLETATPEKWMPYVSVPGYSGVAWTTDITPEGKWRMTPIGEESRFWVDLSACCRSQLEDNGIKPLSIGASGVCTICGAERGEMISHSVAVANGLPDGRFMAYVKKIEKNGTYS